MYESSKISVGARCNEFLMLELSSCSGRKGTKPEVAETRSGRGARLGRSR